MSAAATRHGTATGRRAQARELAAMARALLREAARESQGDLATVRENIATAITATTDVLDALSEVVEQDIRRDAIDHNEYGKEAAA